MKSAVGGLGRGDCRGDSLPWGRKVGPQTNVMVTWSAVQPLNGQQVLDGTASGVGTPAKFLGVFVQPPDRGGDMSRKRGASLLSPGMPV